MLKIAARIVCTIMTLTLAATATTARAEWWEARTSHFIIYSESKREDAEAFARDLERFDNALRTMQTCPSPAPMSATPTA